MRLLLDGDEIVDNWTDPVIAPVLLGRGQGQVGTVVELVGGTEALVEVHFQAPDAETGRIALGLSPLPPTEADNRSSGPAAVTVGYLPPMPADLLGRAERLAATSDAVVVVVGTNEDWESEGFDRDSLALPAGQDELVARIAGANRNVVVVVNAGSPVAMPWASDVAAIVQLWLPGQEAGNSLADVLFGDVNPSGRLPVTVPATLSDSGAAAGYPAVEGRLAYEEGLLVGYRHFDAKAIAPLFCFGHGLSYTSFSYGELEITSDGTGEIRAHVLVTNTGERDGAEVVQFYVGTPNRSLDEPLRELKGVVKLRLGAGQRAVASVPIGTPALSHWDVASRAWTIEPGEIEITVGASSRDLRSRVAVTIGPDGGLAAPIVGG
jgi:beta-glucosidase